MFLCIRWFIISKICALSALIFLVCSGCVGPIEALYPPKAAEPSKSVYVINHNDWHTGIIVRRQDIPNSLWPENNDFADFEYLEVGWGDRDYYQAMEPTKWMAIKAAFWPTQSVLHIVGFSTPVERNSSESEIVEIELSDRGFEQLLSFIQDSYARDELERAIRLGPGLLENSRFYLARGKFYLLRSCNVWTAEALRSAGSPITPLYSITANNFMYQASKFGKIIR